MAFKISENGSWYLFFKKTKFYWSKSTGWKVTTDQSDSTTDLIFEDISIETCIQICPFDDA